MFLRWFAFCQDQVASWMSLFISYVMLAPIVTTMSQHAPVKSPLLKASLMMIAAFQVMQLEVVPVLTLPQDQNQSQNQEE